MKIFVNVYAYINLNYQNRVKFCIDPDDKTSISKENINIEGTIEVMRVGPIRVVIENILLTDFINHRERTLDLALYDINVHNTINAVIDHINDNLDIYKIPYEKLLNDYRFNYQKYDILEGIKTVKGDIVECTKTVETYDDFMKLTNYFVFEKYFKPVPCKPNDLEYETEPLYIDYND